MVTNYFSCAIISHHNTLPLQDQSKAVNQRGTENSQTIGQTKCFFILVDSPQGTEQNSPVDYLSIRDQILPMLDMRSLGLDCPNPSSSPHWLRNLMPVIQSFCVSISSPASGENSKSSPSREPWWRHGASVQSARKNNWFIVSANWDLADICSAPGADLSTSHVWVQQARHCCYSCVEEWSAKNINPSKRPSGRAGTFRAWLMTTTVHYSTQDLSEAQGLTLMVTRMPSLACLAYMEDFGNSHQRGNTFTRSHSNKTLSRSQNGSGKDCLLYQSFKSLPPWKCPGFHTNSLHIWPHFKATNWK